MMQAILHGFADDNHYMLLCHSKQLKYKSNCNLFVIYIFAYKTRDSNGGVVMILRRAISLQWELWYIEAGVCPSWLYYRQKYKIKPSLEVQYML